MHIRFVRSVCDFLSMYAHVFFMLQKTRNVTLWVDARKVCLGWAPDSAASWALEWSSCWDWFSSCKKAANTVSLLRGSAATAAKGATRLAGNSSSRPPVRSQEIRVSWRRNCIPSPTRKLDGCSRKLDGRITWMWRSPPPWRIRSALTWNARRPRDS